MFGYLKFDTGKVKLSFMPHIMWKSISCLVWVLIWKTNFVGFSESNIGQCFHDLSLGKNFLKSKLKTLPIKKHSDEIKNSCLSKGVNKTVREGICKTTKHVVLIHNFWTWTGTSEKRKPKHPLHR
jgi:hypothetical protein